MGISLSYCVSRITESDLHIFPCSIFSTLAKPDHFVELVRVLGHMLNNNKSQLFCSAASLYKKRCNSADGFPSGTSLKIEVRRERKKSRRQKSEEGRDRRSIDRKSEEKYGC